MSVFRGDHASECRTSARVARKGNTVVNGMPTGNQRAPSVARPAAGPRAKAMQMPAVAFSQRVRV